MSPSSPPSGTGRAPIALALDGPDRGTVVGWAAAAGPHVERHLTLH